MSTQYQSSILRTIYSKEYSHPYDLRGTLNYQEEISGIINYYPYGDIQMPTEKLYMFKGEDRTIHLYVKDKDLNPINLTNCSCQLSVKPSHSATAFSFQKTTDVPSAGAIGVTTQGEAYFYLVPADTSNINASQYVFDIRVTTANGKNYVVTDGVLTIKEPVSP